MKSALALRHVHFEDLGSFAPVLEQAGYTIRYLEAGAPLTEAQSTDLLIVLGGPIGAYEEDLYPFLTDTLRLIEQRIAAKRPMLGICLGAQLMARALGAKVYPGAAKEIGWSALSLTEAGEQSPLRHLRDVPVLHWHGDTFDLPQCATRLASTALTPNQSFRVERHLLGLQFHVEADAAHFERWLIGHACEIASVPGLSVTGLRQDTARHGPALATAGQQVLRDWLVGF